MLPDVHREVRNPASMRLVVARRAGPERPAHPVHDLGGCGLGQRADPEGTGQANHPVSR